ncbi:kinase-like domain-containing protein [Syncephalis fuscata]|nr:kinase-like domain-containing protein [Syncephalis fuscata]
MTSQKTEQTFILSPTVAVSTRNSNPHAVAASSTDSSLDLLRDEDLMYANIPDCWNDLSAEKRASAVVWVRACGLTSKEFILANDEAFYAGSSDHCHYQLDANSESQLCFKLLLTFSLVNNTELYENATEVITVTVLLQYQDARVTTFDIHFIERNMPKIVEESTNTNGYRYMITGVEFGSGAFGTVRQAFDRKTRERVAVKVSSRTKSLSSFEREVCALRKLKKHPQFVELLWFEATALNTYLFIQYVAGGDLMNYIKHYSSLPEMEVKHIFRQYLKFLHEKKIVHRGKCPDNILLSEFCRFPKVVYTDFGTAHFIETSSAVPICCGTIPYMAPEALLWSNKQNLYIYHQLTSPPFDVDGYGTPIDMWSLGVTLYAILLERLPYAGSPSFKRAEKLSNEVLDLVERLLDINSKTRCTAEEALNCSWFNSQQDQVDTAVLLEDAASSQAVDGASKTSSKESVAKLKTSLAEEAAVEETVPAAVAPLQPVFKKRYVPFRKCRLNKGAY